MQHANQYFNTRIEFLKGIGTQKAALLNTELSLFTFGDLLRYFPFRHEDRTTFQQIRDIRNDDTPVQIKGRLRSLELLGEGAKKRLVGIFGDGTGTIELVWFKSITWFQKMLRVEGEYIVYGKPSLFGSRFNLSHPDIEPLTAENATGGSFQPIYHLTEKLRKRNIDSRIITKAIQVILENARNHIHENLPDDLLQKYRLIPRYAALWHIHLPNSPAHLQQAQRRLKFEELFFNQLRLIKTKLIYKTEYPGQIFRDTEMVKSFLEQFLSFELTNAQKNVLKEIHKDLKSGRQMNRLLQGDVGSGKTIVAFIAMLMAIENGAQACMMAPTEILADQHYQGLRQFADLLGIKIAKLTGSTKKKDRVELHEGLRNGEMKILIGTQALIEEEVKFYNLGLCIIDEQHRFGVAQRARLWEKNTEFRPHILVMTATPIPRTLAMTFYGELDVSVIDELPAGRKPIQTVHKYDSHRLRVFGFVKEQINLGRQIYFVYPLIEESEKMDLKDLMDGYESVSRSFPDVPISIVHGKMKAKDKDFEMSRFVKNETKIMVATTVIEVGVNVPNASVMVIENAERFGLAQLHQLRGRVGRGAEQSYCILMTDYKLSADTRRRIETMCQTNNGFEIAEVDLELRGYGDLSGTQQSGKIEFLIANLATDQKILEVARNCAMEILEKDPELASEANRPILNHVNSFDPEEINWSRIG